MDDKYVHKVGNDRYVISDCPCSRCVLAPPTPTRADSMTSSSPYGLSRSPASWHSGCFACSSTQTRPGTVRPSCSGGVVTIPAKIIAVY